MYLTIRFKIQKSSQVLVSSHFRHFLRSYVTVSEFLNGNLRKLPAQRRSSSGLDLLPKVVFLPDEGVDVAVVVNALGPVVRDEDVHRQLGLLHSENVDAACVVRRADRVIVVRRPLEMPYKWLLKNLSLQISKFFKASYLKYLYPINKKK